MCRCGRRPRRRPPAELRDDARLASRYDGARPATPHAAVHGPAPTDLRIVHTTTYTYSTPASDSFNEVRLRPADDYRQTLFTFDLNVTPEVSLRSRHDVFGNVVHTFHLPAAHERLEVSATSSVVTYPIPEPIAVGARSMLGLRGRFFQYLAPSRRVPLDRDWLAIFGALPLRETEDVTAYATSLTRYLFGRFDYRIDATHVDTPLVEFAETGDGVCQDYAHAMLAICRSVGIPARYVSGYVHANPSEDRPLQGSEGSHAWVELFLPGSGWVGFDPTNGCLVTEAHVKIGVGRDYDDVPPVSGLRRGGGTSKLFVDVRVRKRDGAEPHGDVRSWIESATSVRLPAPDDEQAQ